MDNPSGGATGVYEIQVEQRSGTQPRSTVTISDVGTTCFPSNCYSFTPADTTRTHRVRIRVKPDCGATAWSDWSTTL